MRKLFIAGAILCALLLAGCSPRDFLTRRLARDLISGSQVFNAPEQFWMRTGVVSNKDFSSPEYIVLQRHGWISGNTVACKSDIAPPPCWDVTLTPAGVDTFRDLIPSSQSPANYFAVPTARRQLVEVTGISKEGNIADVDFTWKWSAVNEVGAALYAGDAQFSSTAEMKRYDDGWRLVERNTAKAHQSLEDGLKNAEPAP
ncbi:MAG TPA: hypothetical protein VGG46_04965 [Terriglobales bacterium]|jgi:hypothetical protein